MSSTSPRMAWYAGTRGEALILGRTFQAYHSRGGGADLHRFVTTGEQGTQLIQALDALTLRPDEAMELLPPDDDPAIRMRNLMETIEQDARRHRASHLIFSGFGPTAAACALVAHARHCPAVWVRPADPCGLVPRQRWEDGLAKVIASLDCVTIEEANGLPSDCVRPSSNVFITGRRASAPLILVSVGRAAWGWNGVLGKLVTALGASAHAMAQADLLILLSMDMRLHAPLRSMENRPGNLFSTAPLPPTDYAALLGEARGMITDSAHVAAECMARGIPVLALGERDGGGEPNAGSRFRALIPKDLSGEEIAAQLAWALEARVGEVGPRQARPDLVSLSTVEMWLAQFRKI